MESLTIKQLEAMCAAFELAFGEDEDFMVWLAEVWQPRWKETVRESGVCNETRS